MPGESGTLTVQQHLTWVTSKPQVEQSWDGHALRVSLDCPSLPIGPSCGVDYLVRIPPGLAVEIRATSGDVRGTDLHAADLVIRTRTGDVDLRFTAAPRRLEVETGSGDVDLKVPAAYTYRVQSDAEQSDVDVPQDPTAPHTITVHTDDGSLSISPSENVLSSSTRAVAASTCPGNRVKLRSPVHTIGGRCAHLSHCDLEVLTELLDVAVGDDAGGEAEERFVDVVAAFPTDS
jgi:hypothetical protein